MRLLRDARTMTSSVLVMLVLSTLRSVIVLRFLGPALNGVWKTALLFDTGSEFLRMGVIKALGIRKPVLDAQGRHQESERVARIAGGFMLWLAIALCAAIFGASFLVGNPDLRMAMRFVAVITGLGQVYYYIREMASAEHNFILRSRETLLRAVVDIVAAALLCRWFGLIGLGTAALLALAVATLYLACHQKAPVAVVPDTRAVSEIIRFGVPYSLTEGAYELTRRLDLLLMAVLLGPEMVGYYGISLLIMDFAIVLAQKGVSQVVSPHLLSEYGRTGSHRDVTSYYEQPARLFSYLLPMFLGAASFFIAGFVSIALPQYGPGIEAAEITVWIVLFAALHACISSYFVAAGMIPSVLRMFSVVIPVAALAQFTLMKSGFGLTGAAWCALATLASIAAAELWMARRKCGCSSWEAARFVTGLFLPALFAVMLRNVIDTLPVEGWLTAPLKAVGFVALYFPILFVYESRFAVLRMVRQAG